MSSDISGIERLHRLVIQNAKDLDGLPPDIARKLARAAARQRAAVERRGCKRVPVCLPIRLRSERERQTLTASVSDLGKGGLFVRSLTPIDSGETVAGAFTIHGKDRSFVIKFRGKVAWSSATDAAYPPGPGLGVGFTKVQVSVLPDGARTVVEDYRGRGRARQRARARARNLP